MSASSDYLRVLTDITREGGATRAATQRANSAIWGSAVAKLGDFASDAVKSYAVDKKAKKDEQWQQNISDLFKRSSEEYQAQQQPSMADLTSGAPTTTETYTPGGLQGSFAGNVPQSHVTTDTTAAPQTFTGPELKNARPPRQSPFPTPSEILALGQPLNGIKVIDGLAALQKLNPQDSEEAKVKRMQAVYRGMDTLSESDRAAAFPGLMGAFEQVYGMPLGDKTYTPEKWKAIGAGLQVAPSKPTGNPTEASLAHDLTDPDPEVRRRAQVALDRLKPTSASKLNTITELRIDAATPDSPTAAHSQQILDNLPESEKVTGPEMDERYRKIMAKPSKARTGDEVAWAGAYERQKAVSQPAVVIQTDQGPRLLDRKNRTADVITTPGGDTVNAPPTQPQAQDASYAQRIADAEGVFKNTEKFITGMSLPEYEIQRRMPAALQSEKFQPYDQASRNLINTILRRESGAAISQSEFDNAKRQYLPQPGDGAEALRLKAQNRKRQLEGLIKGAGPVYTPDTPADRVRVKGPNGETGTVPKGTALPAGWSPR